MTSDQVPMVLAWGAGAGVIAGLAYARFGQKQHTDVNFLLFPALGVFCLAWFFFHVFIDNLGMRRLSEIGFTGAMFLVGTPVAWFMMPFYRRGKRPPQRGPSE